MKTKDIESVLVLAGWSYTVIRVVIDYSNKTPEEKEKFSEKIGKFVDKTIKLIISYYGSPEIYKKAIVDEITKIGKQQVVAEVHEFSYFFREFFFFFRCFIRIVNDDPDNSVAPAS